MEKGSVNYQVRSDGIAHIILTNPPVNALSVGVRQGLWDSLQKISSDSSVKAVVISGSDRAFCGGADISEFGAPMKGPGLIPIIDGIEALKQPVVAAIHGFAFGGGFEIALGCHYRVGTKKTQVGLPEVNLGLLPGAGGTQRLPRLVGIKLASEIMCQGSPLSSEKATKLKIFDKVVESEKELLPAAFDLALSVVGQDLSQQRLSARSVPDLKDKKEFFDSFKKQMAGLRKNEPAPQNIIKAVEAAANSESFKAGMKLESKLFAELMASPEARALQHIFFAERQAAKVEGIKDDIRPKTVKKVGIIGAGLMGGGIAMCYANIGIPVILIDSKQEFLDRGIKIIKGNYERSMKNGRLTAEQLEKRMKLIKPALQYEELKDVDLVIEAVFEDMKLKKEVFSKLDQIVKRDAILCTNTSYLDIDEIGNSTCRPESVMGMHFFSPANVMRLVENVRGSKTSAMTIATCMDEAKRIGKIATLVGNCNGFVGNRMITFYQDEARSLLLEGCRPVDIDKVATKFGMPMGPCQMGDLVGLDLGYESRKQRGVTNPKLYIPDALVENGRLGQKNGKGYYNYNTSDRKPTRSTEAEELIAQVAQANGIKPRTISEQEILERLFYPLINEGFNILAEGIAQRPSDIDIIYCYGYGFPRYRGGPMHWADHVGLDKIKSALERYAETNPKSKSFKVSPLLSECVSNRKSLNQIWRERTKQKAKSRL